MKRSIENRTSGKRGTTGASGAIAPSRWGIVLAGGEGERLRPLIRQRLGHDKPKQFCTLTSDKTLLEETLDRVSELVPRERLVTIIGRDHGRFMNGCASRAGRVIAQPAGRETAPGIFLPAAYILRADPAATVLIFPSDHYISSGPAFSRCVERAAALAEREREKIVLLGAIPDGPEVDYGWIEPERRAAGAMKVSRFREKPDAREAEAMFAQGCLWNTMVMAVKIRTLWAMGRACLPDMMEHFDALLPALGTEQEASALAETYRRLGSFNFSRDIIERLPRQILVVPMEGVEWSDLGRPARILELMDQLGRGWPASEAAALPGPGFAETSIAEA